MFDLPAASTTWLADHHGVTTTAALRDHHVGESTLARLVRVGVLRRVAKGVFVIAERAVDD